MNLRDYQADRPGRPHSDRDQLEESTEEASSSRSPLEQAVAELPSGYGDYAGYGDYDESPGVLPGPAHAEESGATAEGTRRSFRGIGPLGYSRSDPRVREDVCEVLTDAADIDASEIEVSVSNGDVTLSGVVDDRVTKRAAEDLAASRRGVREVHNHLRVRRDE